MLTVNNQVRLIINSILKADWIVTVGEIDWISICYKMYVTNYICGRGIMASCVFNDRCSFLNKKVIDMPLTTHTLVGKYCSGEFTSCAIHKAAVTHGIDKVPQYVSPDDKYELSYRVIELHQMDKSSW